LSQTLKEREELVVRSISSGLSVKRGDLVEDPLLQLEVGI